MIDRGLVCFALMWKGRWEQSAVGKQKQQQQSAGWTVGQENVNHIASGYRDDDGDGVNIPTSIALKERKTRVLRVLPSKIPQVD